MGGVGDRVEQDRDQKFRLTKIHNETKTILHSFMSETRLRQDLTQNSVRDRDKIKSLGVFLYDTKTRTNF